MCVQHREANCSLELVRVVGLYRGRVDDGLWYHGLRPQHVRHPPLPRPLRIPRGGRGRAGDRAGGRQWARGWVRKGGGGGRDGLRGPGRERRLWPATG